MSVAAACSLALLAGCAGEMPEAPRLVSAPVCKRPPPPSAVYRRAEAENNRLLEAEVKRLRVDLQQAEEALVIAESGIRGTYSRVDAISALAEARIDVERVAGQAPWRLAELNEARQKLNEAGTQIEQQHYGAALFFVYRAQRLSDRIEDEARAVDAAPTALFVSGAQVNLRAGPSTRDEVIRVLRDGVPVFPEQRRDAWVLVRVSTGPVGWVHQSLLRQQ